jgi:beta-xylosidase
MGARLTLLALGAALVLAGTGAGAGGTFRNPVWNGDFPDPFVLKVGATYYAYATNGNGKHVQTLTSPDLVHWKPGPDAIPKTASWGFNGEVWAPEVLRRGDGTYVLYYTVSKCIGAATARSPLGPFVDESAKPLVCQARAGGSIDASPFRDRDGSLWLVWKNDGNSISQKTFIWSQRLNRDGLGLVGPRRAIERNDAPWEGSVTEGPMLRRHGGRLYLFYSGNSYTGSAYAVGYATCASPLGPCRDAPENPILKSACRAEGPGHNSLIQVGGQTWIVYHAWLPVHRGDKRVLWIDRLDWKGGKPVVHGPTCGPQPAP